MILDSYHNNVHDILLANIGTGTIGRLKAELVSDVLEMDEYWTLKGEKELAGYSGTEKTTEYGELSNLAKIRLRTKNNITSDVVSGTLTIKSGDKTLIVLELTGNIGDPRIITTEIPEAVKYVPYGTMIQNNNKYSWNNIKYTLRRGSLPEGMELKSNGELYGVPKETGEFTFTVRMEVKSKIERTWNEKEFTLKVNGNTNANVDAATDDGYEVSTRISDMPAGAGEAQVFVSEGEYATFKNVFLDGNKLVSGKDFTSESGSTKITILAETLDKLPQGTHTIGVEFRTEEETLKRAAQNFDIGKSNGDSGNSGSSDSGNSGNSGSGDSGSSGNDDSGNHSDSNANSTSDNSAANTATGKTNTAPSSTNTVQPVVSPEQADTQGISYVDVLMTPDNAKLKAELLQKYYGRNVYLMAHLGNGIGYSILMSEVVASNDLDLSSSIIELDKFAEGFVVFSIKPACVMNLPYQIGMHVKVGTEYSGHPAYIFVFNQIMGVYDIYSVSSVNEIGNVMLYMNELTDVIVMIAK